MFINHISTVLDVLKMSLKSKMIKVGFISTGQPRCSMISQYYSRVSKPCGSNHEQSSMSSGVLQSIRSYNTNTIKHPHSHLSGFVIILWYPSRSTSHLIDCMLSLIRQPIVAKSSLLFGFLFCICA